MKSKIFIIIVLAITRCITAEELNGNCFGISIGAGPSYTFCGISLNYDRKIFGTSILFSPYDFPFNAGCKLRLNSYHASGSVIISPEISFGHHGKAPPGFWPYYIDCNYFGFGLNLTGYVSKHLYIQQDYGIENFEIPHYGLGLGYTLKGGNYCDLWRKKNFIINGIVFGTGSILLFLISQVMLVWGMD